MSTHHVCDHYCDSFLDCKWHSVKEQMNKWWCVLIFIFKLNLWIAAFKSLNIAVCWWRLWCWKLFTLLIMKILLGEHFGMEILTSWLFSFYGNWAASFRLLRLLIELTRLVWNVLTILVTYLWSRSLSCVCLLVDIEWILNESKLSSALWQGTKH